MSFGPSFGVWALISARCLRVRGIRIASRVIALANRLRPLRVCACDRSSLSNPSGSLEEASVALAVIGMARALLARVVAAILRDGPLEETVSRCAPDIGFQKCTLHIDKLEHDVRRSQRPVKILLRALSDG